MAASLNRITIIGNLGKDPQVKTNEGTGNKMAAISVATTERWKDRESGEPRERTEWHRAVAFGPTAEFIEKYMKKGASVFVDGSMRYREYTDNDGIKRQVAEIAIDSIQPLDRRQDNGSGGDRNPNAGDGPQNGGQQGGGRGNYQGNGGNQNGGGRGGYQNGGQNAGPRGGNNGGGNRNSGNANGNGNGGGGNYGGGGGNRNAFMDDDIPFTPMPSHYFM